MDESKGEERVPKKEPSLKIKVEKISSKVVDEPLVIGFIFLIGDFVYKVYETRSRGRKFVKFIGRRKD